MKRNMDEDVVLLLNEPKTYVLGGVAYLDFLQNLEFPPRPRTKPILSKIFPTVVQELVDQGYSISRRTGRE